jgi:hypothetical protein
MPTIQEIIDDVDARMPNRFTDSNKVNWINSFQKKIFRQLKLPGIYRTETIAEQALYELPPSCGVDLIDDVVLEDNSLTYKHMDSEASGTFYYIVDDMIGIYPEPEENGESITVFYKKRPVELSTDDMTAIPDLEEDYHELIKLHLFITMAKANEDPQLANAYTYDYDELFTQLKMDLIDREPGYTHTRDVFDSYGTDDEEMW